MIQDEGTTQSSSCDASKNREASNNAEQSETTAKEPNDNPSEIANSTPNAAPTTDSESGATRICIEGLPRYFGVNEMKKWIATSGIQPRQLKPIQARRGGRRRGGGGRSNSDSGGSICFVTFASSDERRRFLDAMQERTFKGRKVSMRDAWPAPDRFRDSAAKRQKTMENDNAESGVVGGGGLQQMLDSVAPLRNMSYSEQIEVKTQETRQHLVALARFFADNAKSTPPTWLDSTCRQNDSMPCPLLPLVPIADPAADDDAPSKLYRNKCEFTVGYDHAGERQVGFRVTKYRLGSVQVASAADAPHVSPAMKRAVEHFRQFLVQQSSLAPFSEIDKSGHWRQLTVRENRRAQLLLAVYFHPQELDDAALVTIEEELREHFVAAGLVETLLFITASGSMPTSRVESERNRYSTLIGSGFIEETLLESELRFRISPESFFQTNSYGAEHLYQCILDACFERAANVTTLFDLCCGTGTIALLAAKQGRRTLRRIVGIESEEAAIDDARHNAKRVLGSAAVAKSTPDIDTEEQSKAETPDCDSASDKAHPTDLSDSGVSVEFIHGTVEASIALALSESNTTDEGAIAVLDPPRGGVHASVIDAIRASPSIRRVVYAACAPGNLNVQANFYRLVRIGQKAPGTAFRPRFARAIDLGAFTRHVELVVVFDRVDDFDEE